MAVLYVASTETFVGKSAVCMGLLRRMRQDGFSIGYMKPVSVSVMHTPETVTDEDAVLIRETLGLDTPMEQIAPVLLTSSIVDSILRGESPSFVSAMKDAYAAISESSDIVILEGTNSWAEGSLLELPPDRVIDMLNASALLVCRYSSIQSIDTILTTKRYMGERMMGVLLNQVETAHREFVQTRVVPFLEGRNIPVFGVLPRERFLASVTVSELLEHLNGQLIGSREWCDKMVESLMIGAMGADAGLSHFRRHANKAVITGGDRLDIQLVALETSTNVLILTGNIRPALNVLYRAEERRVPIIVVPHDTLTTVERAEELFGRIRFHQHAKLQRFSELMHQHFDFARLYKSLGLRD